MITEVFDDRFPECKFDLFLPENAKNVPLYIYIHGGGITGGSTKEGYALAEYLVKKGIAVASIGYRLYPNAKFPDYLNDCASAVKYLTENASKYGGFSFYTLGGSSAGGYISMMLYFNKEYLENAGVDPKLIKGYFFNAGQPTSHFNYLAIDKKTDSRRVLIDEGAPIFYLDKEYSDPENEPEILIVCADNDMFNRLEQNKMLYNAMLHMKFSKEKVQFKIYDGETHCSYLNKEYYFVDTFELIKRSNGGKL